MEAEYELFEDDLWSEIKRNCSGEVLPPVLYKMKVSGQIVPWWYVPHAQRVLDFEVREDDVWLLGAPRCGTTLSQEMVWLLKNNFDTKKAQENFLFERFPTLVSPSVPGTPPDMVEFASKKTSPRLIKSHLQIPHLPNQLWTVKPKMVFIYRNPKDAAISLYYMYKTMIGYKGPMELVLKSFLKDTAFGNPFWEIVLSFWRLRHERNILLLTYEELNKDIAATMKKVADFLGVKYTEEEETAMLNHLKLSSMKKNKTVNLSFAVSDLKEDEGLVFIRKGEIGGWQKEMSPEMAKMFDQWTEEKLKGTDFPRDNI